MLIVSWPDVSLLIHKFSVESGCVRAEGHRRIVLNRKRCQKWVANLIDSFANGVGDGVSFVVILDVFEARIHLSLLNVVIVVAISFRLRDEHRATALNLLSLNLFQVLLDVLTGAWSVLDNACRGSLFRSEFTLRAAEGPVSTLSHLLVSLLLEGLVVFIVSRAWRDHFHRVHSISFDSRILGRPGT